MIPPLFAVAASIYWQLPILIVVISFVYSATRYDRWPNIVLTDGSPSGTTPPPSRI